MTDDENPYEKYGGDKRQSEIGLRSQARKRSAHAKYSEVCLICDRTLPPNISSLLP